MAKPARVSPILGAVSSMIGEASGTLVTSGGRFNHSFEIALQSITPDPAQARKDFDPAEIEGLAATMAEQGQLQPILVRRDLTARNRWIIIAGERRWRAAQHNRWSTILAIEHNGDPEVAALIENLQRVDLSPLEEARGLQRLIVDKNWSQDTAAAALGKTKSDVSSTLRILTMPDHILEAVVTSQLPPPKSVLVEMARIDDPAALQRLARLAEAGRLTVRAVRDARVAGRTQNSSVVEAAKPQRRKIIPDLTGVIAALQRARDRRVKLEPPDREALQDLRATISALLDQSA